MFTGLIEGLGTVRALRIQTLEIEPPPGETPLWSSSDPWTLGESVAVNGCCLTLISAEPFLRFELSEETLARTTLGALQAGTAVNLERAMRAQGRFGGHLVQGHVDGLGKLLDVAQESGGRRFRFEIDARHAASLIDKGSIAIDGISLTVVSPQAGIFDVAAIPHTLAHTTLGTLRAGTTVNVEFDLVGKYVQKALAQSESLFKSSGAPML